MVVLGEAKRLKKTEEVAGADIAVIMPGKEHIIANLISMDLETTKSRTAEIFDV